VSPAEIFSSAPPAAGDKPVVVREIDGVRIAKVEQTLSPLSSTSAKPIQFKGVLTLTLEDGSQTFACSECDFVGGRGQVQSHHKAEHGPKRRSRPKRPELALLPGIDQAVASMTIGEVLEMARDSASWGDLLSESSAAIEEWKSRALIAEAWRRRVTAKLAQIGFKFEEDGD